MQMPKLRHRCSQLKRATKVSGRMDAKEVLTVSGYRGGAIGPRSTGGGGGDSVERWREECRMLPEGLEILRTKYACIVFCPSSGYQLLISLE